MILNKKTKLSWLLFLNFVGLLCSIIHAEDDKKFIPKVTRIDSLIDPKFDDKPKDSKKKHLTIRISFYP